MINIISKKIKNCGIHLGVGIFIKVSGTQHKYGKRSYFYISEELKNK